MKRLQFTTDYILKQSQVKPSKMHKKLHVSFKDSLKWTKKRGIYIFLVETRLSFQVEIRNNCNRCPPPY